MIITSNTNKPIKEAAYLYAENTHRYRIIIRIIFYKYEQMKYWIYKEEIYESIKVIQGFEKYTLDNLKQDLDSLEAWGNLTTMQDTAKTKTIEEFKNRKFRYQISTLTIELERTLIKLENQSNTSRGSLEISLIERFRETLKEIKNIEELGDKKLYDWWDRLNIDFKYLNENYQDYISKFYSPKTEELFKTTEFLVFKESFIKYLKEFITGIQQNISTIKYTLEELKSEDEKIERIIKKVVAYTKNNIVLKNDYNEDEAYDIYLGRFFSIKKWFIEENGQNSMVDTLLETTNEMIGKITRYALQISEMQYSGGNRKEEYKKMMELFNECEDINEAHKLSSLVFGVFYTKHIVCDLERETESINSSIHNEKPKSIIVNPSIRGYKAKSASRVFVKNKSKEKEEKLKSIIEEREEEKKIIESKIKNNMLVFKELQNIGQHERRIFLSWLSLAINKKDNSWVKNEFGKYYKVKDKNPKESITIKCSDGNFTMPDYELIFKEGTGL